jgi:hypothetical protein
MRVFSPPLLRPAAAVATVLFVAFGCKLDKLISDPGIPLPPVVSITRIQDSAAVGSTAEVAILFDLANPGSHSISWTASTTGSNAWLMLDRARDTAPSQLTATLSPFALAVGMYRDTIIVARADLPDVEVALPVEFQIQPCQLIDVGPGSTDTNALADSDCSAPHRDNHFAKVYRIFGEPDDSITVTLSSSDFGAHLILASSLDPTGIPLLEQSDCPAAPGGACVSNFALADIRPLFIEVTSQAPLEDGTFDLTIDAPRPPLAPGALAQFADEQGSTIPQGGTVPNNELFIRGAVYDVDIMDSVRLEIEVQRDDLTLTDVATHIGLFVSTGDTVLIHVSGLLDNTGYHWQARTVDATGRSSAWIRFGETDPDFQIRVEDAPLPPPYLGQFLSDELTPVPPGGTTPDRTVVFKGTVVDNDPEEFVRLEVELRDMDTPFQGLPTASSVLVPNGETARIIVPGLVDQVDYHWQARAVDQNGLEGPWVRFADTHTEARDFGVNVNATELVVASQPAAGIAKRPLGTIVLEARKPSGVVDTEFLGPILVDILPGTGTPGATLSGTTVVHAHLGVAIFNDLSIDLVGKDYRLTFTTAILPPALSAPITISQTTPAAMVLITQPSERASSGVPFPQQPVIEVRDADGNAAATAGLTIVASLSGGPFGSLSGATTVTTNDAGRAAFTNLAITGVLGGTFELIFREASGRLPQVVSDPISVSGLLDVDPSQTNADVPEGQMGRPTDIKVTTRNSDGAIIGDAVTTLSVAANVESPNAGSPFQISTNADSTYSIVYTPVRPGVDLIGIAVNGVPIAGSPFACSVAPAEIAIVTQPSPLVQEGKVFPQQPTLALVDSTGAAITFSGLAVSVTLGSGAEELRGTVQVVTDSQGVARFTDLSIKGDAGIRTLQFMIESPAAVESSPIQAVKGNPDRPGISDVQPAGLEVQLRETHDMKLPQ